MSVAHSIAEHFLTKMAIHRATDLEHGVVDWSVKEFPSAYAVRQLFILVMCESYLLRIGRPEQFASEVHRRTSDVSDLCAPFQT